MIIPNTGTTNKAVKAISEFTCIFSEYIKVLKTKKKVYIKLRTVHVMLYHLHLRIHCVCLGYDFQMLMLLKFSFLCT